MIELKKNTIQRSDKRDLLKLGAFLDQLSYRHALFLKLGCQKRAGKVFVRWVQ